MNNKIDKVSIDRLKRAYVEKSTTETVSNSLVNNSTEASPAQTDDSDRTIETPTSGGSFEDEFPPLPQPLIHKKRGRPTRQEAAARAAEKITNEQPPVIVTRSGRTSKPPVRL